MKAIFCILAVCLAAHVAEARPKWHQLKGYTFEQYVKDFHRTYTGAELALRRTLFEGRLQDIMAHNTNPSFTWKQGVNHLSDRTEAELKSLRGYNKGVGYSMRQMRPAAMSGEHQPTVHPSQLPTDVDWRKSNIVSPVKNQGECGSCWTFASAEAVESHAAKKTGELAVLSEQQILDCTPNPKHCGGTGGCQGGTAELAFGRINEIGGLSSEWTYSYKSFHGQNFQCQFNTTMTPPQVKVASYKRIPTNQYAPLMEAVATQGPIAISVDASAWSHYETGVFNGCNQTNPDIDHAVLLVGYGTDTQLGDYWLVRNSWSPTWGEEGYIRVYRSSVQRCGEDITPLDGTGCSGGPSKVTVCGTCGILFDNCYPIIE